MSFTTLRLTRELAKLNKENVDGVEILATDDIYNWKAIIDGPKDTPFEDGKFNLELKFNDDYPVKPPSVKFLTQMFHPNIYRDGKICVDILQREWSPAQNIRTILISIRSLLIDPNPDSPANRDAAKLFVSNKKEYYNKVKSMFTHKS
jgi:ubiquitin-conjugating enzyme E2 A